MRRPTPNARGVIRRARRGLLPLVLVEIDLADHVLDGRGRKPAFDEVTTGETLLDIAFEDVVEHVIGRQAVLIRLSRVVFARSVASSRVLRE
jgi:hypothetical protein